MIRLNKYISDSGLCSRRVADQYIEKGKVIINGRKAKIGDKVSSKDIVKVNGQLIEAQTAEDFVLLAYNKPVGITCTTELSVKGNIVEHVNHSERLFHIGRLDKDSQGLIFMTNNGDIVNKMLRAGNKHEKEYLVNVNKPITATFLEGMANGVPILGLTTKKCKVIQESTFVFKIILVQGLNRQIRRMCEHFGYEVTRLERVRIMNIHLKGLPIGDWRELDQQELDGISALIERSSRVEKTKAQKSKNLSSNESESIPEKKSPRKKAAIPKTSRNTKRTSNTNFKAAQRKPKVSNKPRTAVRKKRS